MKIAVLGTGMVGNTLAGKLVSVGHEVKMGARDRDNAKAAGWVKLAGERASHGTFADAAAFGEIAFLCTNGVGTLDAAKAAGADNLRGKIVVDVTNPLDFSKGMPPSLFVSNTDSLGEQVQRALPDSKVVKSLNTISCTVMVDPGKVAGGEHTLFVSGNDAGAKATLTEYMKSWFGWKHVLDLGDITSARGTEAYLLLWLRLWGATGSGDINVKVQK